MHPSAFLKNPQLIKICTTYIRYQNCPKERVPASIQNIIFRILSVSMLRALYSITHILTFSAFVLCPSGEYVALLACQKNKADRDTKLSIMIAAILVIGAMLHPFRNERKKNKMLSENSQQNLLPSLQLRLTHSVWNQAALESFGTFPMLKMTSCAYLFVSEEMNAQ